MRFVYTLILMLLQLFTYAVNGICFKENKSQWPQQVLFGANYKTTKFFVYDQGFSFCILDGNDLKKGHETKHQGQNYENGSSSYNRTMVKGHNYSINFNYSSFLDYTTPAPLKDYYNYFIGNDESHWAGNVKAYEQVVFHHIYKGIDLKLYSGNNDIKYDLIIQPHANPGQIEMDYKNVKSLFLKNGALIVETSIGQVTEQKPYAWQIIKGKKTEVTCEYVFKNDHTVTYRITGNYNPNYELLIDPAIIVCSYDSSPVWSNCWGAGYDEAGNIFVLGEADAGYPVTTGAFQTMYDSLFEDVITKYDANGVTKQFSTYLGGNSYETIQNIVVTKNAITIFGTTYSTDFPTTATAFDKILNTPGITSYNDFYVSRLSLSGSFLLASTYVGGSGLEGKNLLIASPGMSFSERGFTGNMVLDTMENVYFSSSTYSNDFPVTPGAFQPLKSQNYDNVAVKLDSSLSTLLYGTYFGGNGSENAIDCKLINNNELLVVGTTNSNNFPVTTSAVSTVKGLGTDMYILHLNTNASSLIASTYLGTASNDYGYMIDTDLNNDIYVCGGISNTASLVPTPGLYANAGHCTIYKLNATLSSIIYKTKFGASQPLEYTAFKVDSCQNIYIAGIAQVTGFPVTADKFQDYNHGADLYMAVFNANMLSLRFGSYFGGKNDEHSDGGSSRFTSKGVLYHGICINKGDLPVTAGAYQTTFPTTDTTLYDDGFMKIDMQSFVQTSSSYGAEIKGCVPFTAQFNSFSNTGTVSWDFGDGSPVSTQSNISHQYNALGNYTIYLVASDSNTCNKTDTVKTLLEVISQSDLNIAGSTFLCNDQVLLTAETHDPVSYSWSTGATTSTISINSPGSYSVTINNGGCNTLQSVDIVQLEENINDLFPNVVTPNNDAVNDIIDLKKYGLTEVNFTVYDRWGNELFKTQKTDAVFNAADHSDGTYFYSLNYKTLCSDTLIKSKGFITVFR